MSDKPDWAEELAAAIIPVWSEAIDYREPIAAALRKMIADKESEFLQRERKTKAEGVLEASRYFSACTKDELPAFKKHMVETFNEMAIRFEKGEI